MSAIELPPFDASAPCPKCGYDEVATHYQSSAHCHSPKCPTSKVGQPECCDAEHFHRVCQRCRYQWAEAVQS